MRPECLLADPALGKRDLIAQDIGTSTRLITLYFVSLACCVMTFGIIFVGASILAEVPGEDWLLGLFMAIVIVVPLLQLLAFFAWIWAERALRKSKEQTILRAAALGSVIGVLISLLAIFTDVL
jgi:heme/copper-type cytochrome/quinol oxidase subunit 3